MGWHRILFMRVIFAVSLLALLLAVPAWAGETKAKRTELDEKVDSGLAFLQRQQEADGSWGTSKGGARHTAITALSVMAFLSAGHVPGEGKYGETVEKGVRWVMKQQNQEGLLAADAAHEMYHHGICTLMLAEVAGMTDGKLGDEVRDRLKKAITVTLKAQRNKDCGQHEGGWRYHVAQSLDRNTSDISCTGWQILSLRAAKDLGCDVPPEAIDRAVDFVKRCQLSSPDKDSDGAFHYLPGNRITSACTGTSVLCLELSHKGKGHAEESLRGGNYLLNHIPAWGGGSEGHFFYAAYYSSQAMFQLGGNYWDAFSAKLRRTLLDNQQKDSGGWFGGDNDAQAYGPNYATAMAILALTVEYHYLPIYQRGEEPGTKDKK